MKFEGEYDEKLEDSCEYLRKITDSDLEVLVNTVVNIDSSVKQIMFIKSNLYTTYKDSLVVIVNSTSPYKQYEILNEIISKLSAYRLSTYVFATNEKLPIKILSALITNSCCTCVYGSNFRIYTLNREILNYQLEYTNKRLEQAKEIYSKRFEKQPYTMFSMNEDFDVCGKIGTAFKQLFNAVEKLYYIYDCHTIDNILKDKYNLIKYLCTVKYNTLGDSIYTSSELELAYETVENLVKGFISDIKEALNSILEQIE